MPRTIAVGVQQQGIDVLTTEADGTADRDDEFLLQRATDRGRVVFTQDRDFLALAAAWQHTRREFTGMVYAHEMRMTIIAAATLRPRIHPRPIRSREQLLLDALAVTRGTAAGDCEAPLRLKAA